MKIIKAGVIGVGYIGMVHIEVLQRIPGVQVIAIADSNEDLAKAAIDKYNIPKSYKDASELIDDPEVEVVHNCTPNRLHFELNKAAILKGKQIVSEKPLAMTAAQSAELVSLSKENNTVTAVNFCYRYYPVVQETAARVKNGELGEIRALMGHFLQDWLFYDTDYSWRLEKEEAGESNVLGDLGSHWCDIIQFVSGRKIIKVMAEKHTCIPVRKKPKDGPLTFSNNSDFEYEETKIELDEFGSMIIVMDNGARGTFTSCQVAAGKKVELEFQLFGSKCTYAWNHSRPNELHIGNRDKGNETFYESPSLQSPETKKYAILPTGHPMGYHDAVYNLFSDFYIVVNAKKEGKDVKFDLPDFKAGHEEMKILEAAVKSCKTESWQTVN